MTSMKRPMFMLTQQCCKAEPIVIAIQLIGCASKFLFSIISGDWKGSPVWELVPLCTLDGGWRPQRLNERPAG